MTTIPEGVRALLGPAPEDRSGEGEGRVLAGNGRVARVGRAAVVAREAFVLRLDRLPLEVPPLVDAGEGWLVAGEVGDDEAPWSGADLWGALEDLARLHDAYEDALPAGVAVLRHPFDPAAAGELLGRARSGVARLPAVLARVLDDPAPVLEVLAAEPPTLLHGDPWPGNIRRPEPGRRVWVDWEQASVGPAAADLATWLDQTPWFLRREIDTGEHLARYLAARVRPVDVAAFGRAVDAASVVWFLAFDVPRLGEVPPWLAEHMVSAREAAAARVLG